MVSIKKTGHYAESKITIKTKELSKLNNAVGNISPLFENQRYKLDLNKKQPVFEAKEEYKDEAIKLAYKEAIKKANIIADTSGAQLGKMIMAKELSKAKRNSGAYGDGDWWGDDDRFSVGSSLMAGGAEVAEPEEIKSLSRTIWVRYVFRFEII